jgi:hypothetical protein
MLEHNMKPGCWSRMSVYCLDSSGLGYDPSAESYEYGNEPPLLKSDPASCRVGAVNCVPVIAFRERNSALASVQCRRKR